MNALIRDAITEKLIWLNEEKESLDSKIEDYQSKLKEMIILQKQYDTTINETVQFLKDNKTNVAAKGPKTGQKRDRAS